MSTTRFGALQQTQNGLAAAGYSLTGVVIEEGVRLRFAATPGVSYRYFVKQPGESGFTFTGSMTVSADNPYIRRHVANFPNIGNAELMFVVFDNNNNELGADVFSVRVFEHVPTDHPPAHANSPVLFSNLQLAQSTLPAGKEIFNPRIVDSGYGLAFDPSPGVDYFLFRRLPSAGEFTGSTVFGPVSQLAQNALVWSNWGTGSAQIKYAILDDNLAELHSAIYSFDVVPNSGYVGGGGGGGVVGTGGGGTTTGSFNTSHAAPANDINLGKDLDDLKFLFPALFDAYGYIDICRVWQNEILAQRDMSGFGMHINAALAFISKSQHVTETIRLSTFDIPSSYSTAFNNKGDVLSRGIPSLTSNSAALANDLIAYGSYGNALFMDKWHTAAGVIEILDFARLTKFLRIDTVDIEELSEPELRSVLSNVNDAEKMQVVKQCFGMHRSVTLRSLTDLLEPGLIFKTSKAANKFSTLSDFTRGLQGINNFTGADSWSTIGEYIQSVEVVHDGASTLMPGPAVDTANQFYGFGTGENAALTFEDLYGVMTGEKGVAGTRYRDNTTRALDLLKTIDTGPLETAIRDMVTKSQLADVAHATAVSAAAAANTAASAANAAEAAEAAAIDAAAAATDAVTNAVKKEDAQAALDALEDPSEEELEDAQAALDAALDEDAFADLEQAATDADTASSTASTTAATTAADSSAASITSNNANGAFNEAVTAYNTSRDIAADIATALNVPPVSEANALMQSLIDMVNIERAKVTQAEIDLTLYQLNPRSRDGYIGFSEMLGAMNPETEVYEFLFKLIDARHVDGQVYRNLLNDARDNHTSRQSGIL